jgi:hypothetical protein
MEYQCHKHVKIVCTLHIGQAVRVERWGYELDGKDLVIQDIKFDIGKCESSVMVKVDKYPNYIDSSWITVLAK